MSRVRNIITSMRLNLRRELPEFFRVGQSGRRVLQQSSDFKSMDFATRNLYRSAIEDLARGAHRPELEIARAAAAAAARAEAMPRTANATRATTAGGRAGGLRAHHRLPRPASHTARRLNACSDPRLYRRRRAARVHDARLAGGECRHSELRGDASILAVLASSRHRLAVALVNRIVTRSIGASTLPALAFLDGFPPTSDPAGGTDLLTSAAAMRNRSSVSRCTIGVRAR